MQEDHIIKKRKQIKQYIDNFIIFRRPQIKTFFSSQRKGHLLNLCDCEMSI